ncbi:uncharacterized protein Z520_00741 [Fonsecaea multimorphosa CBS 102226]|uniref:ubiquitinyl hydrolase 1 n=1 Tax=Fonsecaea multimorphosa CBS 102226 TaxID=1442371 RepID=A0A0D2L4R6_9EURO|nr:uncharacterized protein Z520_00741 [Fonsecaea multimorphosa CBS 102226]KIY04049.1 hypothetical protein Z520_00741 [Fonsecaea multimorphosa CBS 102226]OAL31885.1 hypothetical protein AYO22_00755 [Fonsecaea multimorphosa]
MNNLPVRANESPFYDRPSDHQITSYPTETKIISTLALLLLGYYALSFLDAWPSTIKRAVYEFAVYITPGPLIYALQYGMVRLGRLSPEEANFIKANFGDMVAKQEAFQKILGQPQLPLALRKVRSLSGSYMPLVHGTGPPGLGNWDNSCYQNSVLQGLASLPAFIEYLEQSMECCDRYDATAPTHRALVAFLEQLSDPNSPTTVLWTPKILKSMDSWQQQDAQEYFSRVLDAVEKEANQYVHKMKRSTIAGLECLRTLEKKSPITDAHGDEQVQCSWTSRIRGQPAASLRESGLRNPVDGMTAQCLECMICGFTEGLSLTQFNCLTLNLGLQGACDVATLLDEYTAPEEVEGVECENCTKLAHGEADTTEDEDKKSERADVEPKKKKKSVLRTKAKQITVGRLPKDLVLHINRSIFDNYGNQLKNTAQVRAPPRLHFLSRWCAPLDKNDNSVEAVYELKCVVTHYGSHHDGHYIALGKRDKDWYSFNDERVTRIAEEEVLSRGNGFMLFYEAVGSPPPSRSELEMPKETTATSANLEAVISEMKDHLDLGQGAEIEEQPIRLFDDDEVAESESDMTPSSETSQDSNSASSKSSSPVKTSAEEFEMQNGTVRVPVMDFKTATDMSSHVVQGPSTGGITPVVPVL